MCLSPRHVGNNFSHDYIIWPWSPYAISADAFAKSSLNQMKQFCSSAS